MSVPFRHRKLGYVALNVTDIENSITFYRDTVGLDLTASADQTAFFRCSQDHHNVILYEAEKPGLKRIGWEVENVENLELAQKHFAALGLETKDVDENELSVLCQGRSFRVREPNTKLTFEYYGNIQQSPKEFQPRAAKIARLGHVAVRTKDFSATLNFVTQKMNFRVSDTFGDVLAFLRCFPNPYHHSYALGRAPENGLHHVNFMVTDIHDVGSGSVMIYFLDPDGLTLEYSYGMEEFPELGPRKPETYEPIPESLDTWGSPLNSSWGATGEIEMV
jgi:2,3-dihydroxy-p-cumate/2,3-dihydroxybenzoate 3,4-dioxygenase